MIAAIVFFLWICRSLQLGVYARESDVKVIGFIFSRRVPWPEVDRFAVGPTGQYKKVGQLYRTDHSLPIPLFGITGSTAQPLVDELNARLVEWRSAHP